MSINDVQKILDGLHALQVEVASKFAAIETRMDTDRDLRGRVRRLELAGVALGVLVIGYAAGVDIPVIGQNS